MQTEATLSLDLAGLLMRIHADSALHASLARLETAWGSCVVPSIDRTPDTEIFAAIDEQTGEPMVWAGAFSERGEFSVSEGHFAIERALYAELVRLLSTERQLLHAGAVVSAEGGFLFVGPSGAGKSSLCLAAVQKGARYLADDLLTTDGDEVRGVARAIQFEPKRVGTPFPLWLTHAALDFTTYGRPVEEKDTESRRTQGDENTTPLFVPGRGNTLPRAPARAFATVLLERGPETTLTRVSRVEALAELVGASFVRDKGVDLGQLLSRGAYRLVWRDPDEAWYQLSRVAL
jgi:hypothetical protein